MTVDAGLLCAQRVVVTINVSECVLTLGPGHAHTGVGSHRATPGDRQETAAILTFIVEEAEISQDEPLPLPQTHPRTVLQTEGHTANNTVTHSTSWPPPPPSAQCVFLPVCRAILGAPQERWGSSGSPDPFSQNCAASHRAWRPERTHTHTHMH